MPKAAVATLSNAMDVGNPSNFVRILEMFEQNHAQVSGSITGYTVTDEETATTLRQVYQDHHYLLDPHGAVAYHALQRYLEKHPTAQGIFLETAHPVKFYDVVEPITGEPVPLPAAIQEIIGRPKTSIPLAPDYAALKAYLLSR